MIVFGSLELCSPLVSLVYDSAYPLNYVQHIGLIHLIQSEFQRSEPEF